MVAVLGAPAVGIGVVPAVLVVPAVPVALPPVTDEPPKLEPPSSYPSSSNIDVRPPQPIIAITPATTAHPTPGAILSRSRQRQPPLTSMAAA